MQACGICFFLKFHLERPNGDQNNSGKLAARPGLLHSLHPTKAQGRVPYWASVCVRDFFVQRFCDHPPLPSQMHRAAAAEPAPP